MAESAPKMPIKTAEAGGAPASEAWRPFEGLRREIDRLFEDFDRGRHLPFRRGGFDLEPFWKREMVLTSTPAVDVVEKADAYEITAELPGIDEKNVEVKLANGTLIITGEKKQEKAESTKDCYLSERRYGAFQRSFGLPDGVDADRIDAQFKNGVLHIVLPKTPDAQKQPKKIAVRAG